MPLIPRRGSSDPIVTGQAHNRVFFVSGVQLRGFRKSRFQFRPPLIVKCLHFGNLIRVLTDYALRLPRIFGYIVKFFLINQPPTLTHNGRLSPFDWIFDPLGIGYQHTVRPVGFTFRLQNRTDGDAVELITFWFLTSRQIKKSRGFTATA